MQPLQAVCVVFVSFLFVGASAEIGGCVLDPSAPDACREGSSLLQVRASLLQVRATERVQDEDGATTLTQTAAEEGEEEEQKKDELEKEEEGEDEEDETEEKEEGEDEQAEGRRRRRRRRPTARAAVKAMGVGINLGQKFEDKANRLWQEKAWAIIPLIDAFAHAGFEHVRIPVTWGSHMWSKGGHFVNQVTQAVKHALSKGLWVVINTHHEFDWLKNVYDGQEHINHQFWTLWRDIATHFKDFSNKLIFEVLNEPEHKFGDWNKGKNEYGRHPRDSYPMELTRKINNVGYDAIRSVSKKRIIMVSPNAQANANNLLDVYGDKGKLPKGGNDKFLAVTIHTYDPWGCCGEDGNNNECRVQGPIPKVNFDEIGNWMKQTGIPVHWGEYGIGRRHNRNERWDGMVHDYYTTVVRETLKRGMSNCVWDDQGWFEVTNGSGEWVYGIKDAIMRGKDGKNVAGGGGSGDCAKNCHQDNSGDSSCKSRVDWVRSNLNKNLQDSIKQVNGECKGQCSCTKKTYKR